MEDVPFYTYVHAKNNHLQKLQFGIWSKLYQVFLVVF